MQQVSKNINLWTRVLIDISSTPNERVKTNSYSKFDKKSKPTKLSDEQILEIRALNEFAHWNYNMLMEKYGMDRKTISRCCEYYNKAGLMPKKSDIPDWAL